jgi:hypothetical protein
MDNNQKKLLATISAVHCLRGFLEVYPFIRNAVNTAFKLDWMKGERDDALYWKKQATVLGRMQLQAQRALEFVPAKEGHRLGTGGCGSTIWLRPRRTGWHSTSQGNASTTS